MYIGNRVGSTVTYVLWWVWVRICYSYEFFFFIVIISFMIIGLLPFFLPLFINNIPIHFSYLQIHCFCFFYSVIFFRFVFSSSLCTSGLLSVAFKALFALFSCSPSLFLPPLSEFSQIFMILEPSDTKQPSKIDDKPKNTWSFSMISHDYHFSIFIDFDIILDRIFT